MEVGEFLFQGNNIVIEGINNTKINIADSSKFVGVIIKKIVNNLIILLNYLLRIKEALNLDYSDIIIATFNIVLGGGEFGFISFKFFLYLRGLNIGGDNIVVEKAALKII